LGDLSFICCVFRGSNLQKLFFYGWEIFKNNFEVFMQFNIEFLVFYDEARTQRRTTAFWTEN
jgi:hypothetical protein